MKSQIFFSKGEDDLFVKSIKKYKKPELGEKQLDNWFSILTNPDKMKFSKFFLEMYNSVLLFKKNNFKEEFGFLDIKNCFIKKSKRKINNIIYYYLKFSKWRSYEILYHKDKKVIKNWYNLLKKHCILLNFSKKFNYISKLGTGNFGKVYLVEKIKSKKKYAVKIIKKSEILKTKDDYEKKVILNEINLIRKLNSNYTIKLLSIYEGKNNLYILTNFCEGKTLFQHIIENGNQSESKSLLIILQVLQGINYLHKKNIIHRDIKPDNIIINDNKHKKIVICDLGFGSLIQEINELFYKCGTPGFMAPEILNEEDYDFKIDIFSAGVVFFLILTGRMPFKGESNEEIIERNKNCEFEFSLDKLDIDISEECLDLLKKLLEKNKDQRISAEKALLHPVFKKILSKSPLIIQSYFDAQNIIQNKNIINQKSFVKFSKCDKFNEISNSVSTKEYSLEYCGFNNQSAPLLLS